MECVCVCPFRCRKFVQFVLIFFFITTGNIHVYTNRGASYSRFYQPRRRRTFERREEEVQENRSQVSPTSCLSLLSLCMNPCSLLITIFILFSHYWV